MLSTAVGIDGKVLSTRLLSMPGSYGVWVFGSHVSVWAMPPAIQRRITVSAVALGLAVSCASRRGASQVNAAMAAAADWRM